MTQYRRALVASQFHRARRRAAVESLLARFSGQPTDLLSFTEVTEKLGITGQSSLGLRQIPVDAIIGSVGRYQDFSRTFLPRLESDEDRWVSVGAAAPIVTDLPPIDVYQIGDVYFVLDGNHRVSLARSRNIDYIDANVIEVRTRAPMPPGARPDDLIIAAELGAFLALTRLDITHPEADFRVSVPGQYRNMENHIEAHRFVSETEEGRDLTYDDAVERWYGAVYLPLVEAIREQGILRYFPGRTETDFFVWLARHRADLQNELHLNISPDVTVSRLTAKVEAVARAERKTLAERLRRLARLTLSEPAGGVGRRTWAQERTLDRYSDHLFASVLFPAILDISGKDPSFPVAALARSAVLSREEGAKLTILGILPDHAPDSPNEVLIESFRREYGHEISGANWLVERGDPLRRVIEIGFLHDLIIVERSFDTEATGEKPPGRTIRSIIERSRRPVLVLDSALQTIMPQRVLVVHDTRRHLDEAIFIAAYLAERWMVELSVLPLSNGRNTGEIVANIGDYLALHEVTATFLEPVRPNAAAGDHIISAGLEGEFDLLLMTGPEIGRTGNRTGSMTDVIFTTLENWSRSTLIAT